MTNGRSFALLTKILFLTYKEEKGMSEKNESMFATLDEILRKRGITKISFAKKIGVTNITLQRWVSGINYPSYETLKRICEELGITATELLGF